jgi:hypothetical protein
LNKYERWTNKRLDDFITENAPGYTRLSDVINTKTKVTLFCDSGSEWSVLIGDFVRKHYRCNCIICKSKLPKRKRAGPRTAADIESKGFILLSDWKTVHDKVDVKCVVCGYENNVFPIPYIYYNAKCTRCSGRERITTERFKDIVFSDGYVLLSECTSAKSKCLVKCDKGHLFIATADNYIRRNSRCPKCVVDNRVGENHPNWKADLSEEDRIKTRGFLPYRRWARLVKERDNFICQACFKRGVRLHSHHIEAWNHAKELRYELDNGVTLCVACHSDFHRNYGRGNNTVTQYDEWLTECKRSKNEGERLNGV